MLSQCARGVFLEASYILNYMLMLIQGGSLVCKVDGRELKAWILFLALLFLGHMVAFPPRSCILVLLYSIPCAENKIILSDLSKIAQEASWQIHCVLRSNLMLKAWVNPVLLSAWPLENYLFKCLFRIYKTELEKIQIGFVKGIQNWQKALYTCSLLLGLLPCFSPFFRVNGSYK